MVAALLMRHGASSNEPQNRGIEYMKKNIFLYSGEGTQSSETQYRLLKHSAYWLKIENILSSKLNLNLEQLWNLEIGRHRCPYSPLLTVITQICLSDIWRQWGYRPDGVIGHST